MSIIYCDYCQRNIDTDFDAEHFDAGDDFTCIEEQADEEADHQEVINDLN